MEQCRDEEEDEQESTNEGHAAPTRSAQRMHDDDEPLQRQQHRRPNAEASEDLWVEMQQGIHAGAFSS